MHADEELVHTKNELYQQIGRNVLLYQQVEHVLKKLIKKARLSFSLSPQDFAQTAEKPDKRTTGQLVDPFLSLFEEPAPIEQRDGFSPEKIWFSLSFTFKLTPEETQTYKNQLQKVISARNELIHHSLQQIQLASVQSCREMIKELEERREEIFRMRDCLLSICRAVDDGVLQMRAKLVESPEFFGLPETPPKNRE